MRPSTLFICVIAAICLALGLWLGPTGGPAEQCGTGPLAYDC